MSYIYIYIYIYLVPYAGFVRIKSYAIFVFQKLEYTTQNISNDFVQSGISPEKIEQDLKHCLKNSQPMQNDAIHELINVRYPNKYMGIRPVFVLISLIIFTTYLSV